MPCDRFAMERVVVWTLWAIEAWNLEFGSEL